MSTTHTLVVEPDTESIERLAAIREVSEEERASHLTWHIECSDPAACDGFIECSEAHEVDGASADDGPHDTACGGGTETGPCTVPWCGQEEFTFHGKPHEWRDGYGWTVDWPGCPVASADYDLPDELPRPLVAGRWEVTPEWDEDFLTIYLTEPKKRGARK